MKLYLEEFRIIAFIETSRAYGSKRAAQILDALQALLVGPVFENEKSKGSDEKLVTRKIAFKNIAGRIPETIRTVVHYNL